MPVMPDTRIPLSGISEPQQTPVQSPMQTLGSMMQIKESQQQYRMRELQAKKAQDDYDDDQAVARALQKYERPEDAMPELRSRPTAFFKLGKDIHAQRTGEYEETAAKLKTNAAQLQMAAQALNSATDQATYDGVREYAVNMAAQSMGREKAEQLLPTIWDKDKVKQVVNLGTDREHQIQMELATATAANQLLNATANMYEGGMVTKTGAAQITGRPADPNAPEYSAKMLDAMSKYQDGVAQERLAATTKAQYDGILARERARGGDANILAKFEAIPWDPRPDAPTNHRLATKALGMTIPQREEAETRKVNAETEAKRADDAVITAQQTEYNRRLDYQLRERDVAAREKRAAAALAAAQAGGVSTGDARTNAAEDKLETKFTKIDEKAKEQYERRGNNFNFFTPDTPAKGTTPASKTGKYSYVKGGGEAFEYGDDKMQQLPDDDPLKQWYIKARLDAQDEHRQRINELPSIEQAATAARQNGDVAGYEKLQKEVTEVTHGVGKLETIVPWNEADRAKVKAKGQAGPADRGVPSQQERAAAGDRVRQIFQYLGAHPELSPTQRQELKRQADDLTRRSKGLVY